MNCLIYKNKHLKIANFRYSRFFDNSEGSNFIVKDDDLYNKCEVDIDDGIHYMSPEYIEDK